MIACIGSCFPGPKAISQDFFNFRVSISACVGIFLGATCDFLPLVALEAKPGGSGMLLAFFARGGTGLCNSVTHFGGNDDCAADMAMATDHESLWI